MLRRFKATLARLHWAVRLTLVTMACLAAEAAALYVALFLQETLSLGGNLATANMERGSRIMSLVFYVLVPLAALSGSLAAFALTAPNDALRRALPAALLVAVLRLFMLPVALLFYWFGLGIVALTLWLLIPPALGSALLWAGKHAIAARQEREAP